MKPYRWLALAPILLACDSSPLTGRGSPADVVDAVSRDDAPSDDTLVDDLAAPSDAVEATDAGGDLEDDATDTFEKTDVSTDTFEKTDISTDTVENTETPTDTEAPADTDTDTEADTEAPADTEADVISNLCNPPLEVLPALSYVHPRELVTFDVNGGTGSPRFELVSSSSGLGADVHPFLGVYIAGSSPDTVDRVRVTDRLCEGEAIAEIRVVAPLAVSPSTATIAPLQHILLEVRGGSGALSFELVQNESGASVDANGYYLAGPLPGFDRVRITDIETHATRTLSVSVDPDGQLALVPPRIALPVGARWKLGTANGSGAFDVVANGTSATITDGWVDALAPGETSFTVTDRHTGESLEGQIDVISQLGFERYRAGDGSLTGVALGPGDIDGDDLPDAIIAFTEADVGHLNAGALYIYRGTDTPAGPSLDPTPVRILSGDNRNDNLGRAAAVADLDKDGLPELLVGVPFADPSGTNVGLVRIYPGVEGAFFGEESTRTFVGEDPGDTFGTSLAVCDFNGDSYPDLAIGAPLAEDSTLAGTTDSGGVLIWLGSPDGFATLPDQRLYGEKPAGDIWLVAAGARLGQAMAAGDMDGDGLCDLAVGATDLATTADRTSDGAVWIFRGRGPDAFSAGGVESHARLAWAGTDPSVNTTRLGYTLAMGDLDGDGLADLAMSQHAQKVSNFTNHGVVRVVFGGPFPEAPYPPTWLSPDSVDWTWSGGNGAGGASSDFLGFTLAIGDWDGTPPLDLFVGGLDDELTGTPAAGGVIFVLPGVEGGPPSTTYTRAIAGSSAGMRLGALLAPIGDLDGDGKSELVARAPNDSRVASRLGSHQLIPSTNAPHLELDADQSSAGARIGQSVAVLPDLDGDGDPELTVGAPSAQASTPLTLFRGGVFSLHRGTASGFDPTPAQRFENTTALSSLEGLGDAMVGLPDFDGDGRPDLAVIVARDGTTTAPCGTPTARSGVGSVHVFRGQADGTLATTPSYIYWGEQPSQRIERLTTADVDGDGKSDLLIGHALRPRTSAPRATGRRLLGRSHLPRASRKRQLRLGARPARRPRPRRLRGHRRRRPRRRPHDPDQYGRHPHRLRLWHRLHLQRPPRPHLFLLRHERTRRNLTRRRRHRR